VRDGRSQQRPWLLGVSMASAVCVAYLLQVLLNWADVAERSLYANLGMIPIGFAATVLAASAARAETDDRARWAWRLLAAAFACFLIGDVLYFIFQNILGRSPFPSPADAGYLVYYPLMLAGLLWLPVRRADRRRLALYSAACAILLMGGAAAILKWLLLPALETFQGDHFAYALSVGYPVGDLLLLAGVAWVLFHSVDARRSAVLLLAAGVCVGLLADLVYGYQNLNGTSQPGGLSDAYFMVSWTLYAWAGYAEVTWRRKLPVPERGLGLEEAGGEA
jgi:hypothetical protein